MWASSITLGPFPFLFIGNEVSGFIYPVFVHIILYMGQNKISYRLSSPDTPSRAQSFSNYPKHPLFLHPPAIYLAASLPVAMTSSTQTISTAVCIYFEGMESNITGIPSLGQPHEPPPQLPVSPVSGSIWYGIFSSFASFMMALVWRLSRTGPTATAFALSRGRSHHSAHRAYPRGKHQ